MFNYRMFLLLLLVSTFQVNAVVLTGDTAGFFGDDPDAQIVAVEWGGDFTAHSSLEYLGVEAFFTETKQPFIVGTLIYNNRKTEEVLSEVNLNIDLSFTQPAGTDNFVFNYDLSIVETDNSLPDSADRVSLIPAEGFNPSFLIGGTEFYFELLGFKKDDNFFEQQENSKSPVNLYAKISAVPVPSAVWLFITALSGFFLMGKRRAV